MALSALSLPTAHVRYVSHPSVHRFPSTVEEVDRFAKAALDKFKRQMTQYYEWFESMGICFGATVQGWNDVVGELDNQCLVLKFAKLTTEDPTVIAAAQVKAEELEAQLNLAFCDEKALAIVLFFANMISDKDLTPPQNHLLIEMLQSVPLENPHYASAFELKTKLTQRATRQFFYDLGFKREKRLPENRTLTILNWNVCFFDDPLPMLFGGVRPYRDRIDQVAKTIINSKADIICLQEVFSPNANVELVQELKPHFTYFYFKIGPKVVGFNKDNKGIPSGLFVASLYRLENPKFIPYTPNEQTPRSRAYGFFTADIYNDQKPLAHLITTHLQPGSDPDDRNYRAKQMAAIRSDMKQSPLPALACGDFNIEENSEEAKQLLEGFVMNKTPGWTCRELRDFWFKAHQNTDVFNARLDVESIDYFFADLKDTAVEFQTAIGIVNDVHHPEQALSDHQYEITTVTFPSNNQ